MAITVDQANIGTVTTDGTGTTIVITTNQNVAAGATIVAGFAYYASNEDITGVVNSGTDLGWTIDNAGEGSGRSVAIARAYAPAGLSSGATITATIANTGGDYRSGGAMSLLGVESTNPVDGTPPASVDATGTATWSTGSVAIAAGSVLVGACLAPTTSSHSPTAPSEEAWEAIDVPDTYGSVMCYRIESSAGSYAVGGTWGASGNHRNVAVAYLAAADAGQVLQASADSADGNWTNQAGSATDLFASIDEDTPSDSDYIRSELSPNASGCRVKLEAGGDPAVSTDHVINWRIAKDASGGQTVNMTVKLYQGGGNSLGGGTLIADFDRNDVSSSFTDYAEALSGGEADAITDYTDLYLEFWADVP